MEKPIVLGVEGESADIVRAADAGYCIEPENAVELADRLLQLRESEDLRRRFGRNGRIHVSAHYDRLVLARRFEELLRATCSSEVR